VEDLTMAADLEMNYQLYVDSDKPKSSHKSLQEAKNAANPYIDDKKLPLTIERGPTPVPSAAKKEIWRYDHALHDWSIQQ
jgi:hypothetical protein